MAENLPFIQTTNPISITETENPNLFPDLQSFKEISQEWISGNREIRNGQDPIVMRIAQAVKLPIEPDKKYALVAHGSRDGWNQTVIDEIGLVAPERDWSLVVAGTDPFRQHLTQIDTLIENSQERSGMVWNVWLAPVSDKDEDGCPIEYEDQIDVTYPWMNIEEELGWNSQQLNNYLIETLGQDTYTHKFNGIGLNILPRKYQIARF